MPCKCFPVAHRLTDARLKVARGTVDGAAIRQEGERLLGTLEERLVKHRELMDESLGGTLRSYFDPASGAFTERVQRLLRHDGELATVIGSQVDSARRTLDELLARHLGDESPLRRLLSPEEGNTFIAAVRSQVRQALEVQSQAIAHEFSLDLPDSALSRLVHELKDRHGDLERSLGERVASVVGEFSLERIVTRRDDARRSTLHGNEFEQRVGEQLQAWCCSDIG